MKKRFFCCFCECGNCNFSWLFFCIILRFFLLYEFWMEIVIFGRSLNRSKPIKFSLIFQRIFHMSLTSHKNSSTHNSHFFLCKMIHPIWFYYKDNNFCRFSATVKKYLKFMSTEKIEKILNECRESAVVWVENNFTECFECFHVCCNNL